jgi:ParB family transcriptional regulator, chromosome partitioning protein
MTQIQNIALDKIEPDPEQPRKYFDEQKLRELAHTIVEHGVIVPITLRPHTNAKKREAGHYLLDTGERRWRASALAGLTEIPAIVQADGETIHAGTVLERQLIENTQRADLSALEEGETYRKLREGFQVPIEDLMSRVGKSRSQIYARIALTKLPAAVKKAIGEGRLSSAIAELAATIGDPKLQEQFAAECTGKGKDLSSLGISSEALAADEEKPWDRDAQPLSYRAAKELLRRRYSTRLALAKFDPDDATLTAAGACGPCAYRSGKQLEIGAVAGTTAAADDVCVKTSCFEEKTKATWKRAAEAAKATGLEVLGAKDTKEIFHGAEVRGNSPYVGLDTPLPYELQVSPGKPQTFGKLLGKRAGDVPRVLVQDETGAPRVLLDKSEAVKVLRELGKIDKPAKRDAPKGERAAIAKANKDAEAQNELQEAALTRLLAQLDDLKIPAEKDVPFLRWVGANVLTLTHELFDDSMGTVLARHQLSNEADLVDLFDRAKTVRDMHRVIAEIFIGRLGGRVLGVSDYADQKEKELYASGLKLLGLNWPKALASATEAAEHEAASKAASEEAAKLAADQKPPKPAKKGGK